MTRHPAAWLLAIIVFIGAAAACSDTSDLEGRIATLEAELESSPAIGDLIVVGKEVNLISGSSTVEVCVRYRVFGSVDETCLLVGDRTPAEACFEEARVGLPLPQSCN